MCRVQWDRVLRGIGAPPEVHLLLSGPKNATFWKRPLEPREGISMKSNSPPAPSALLIVATACLASPLVAVADPLGAYAGASVGQSTVKADPLQFSKHDLGWK